MKQFNSYNYANNITAKQFWTIYLGIPIVAILGSVLAGQIYHRTKKR